LGIGQEAKKPLGIDELISMSEELAMKKVSKDPVVKKELQDLQLQVAFYKKLSEILEAENKDVKKKHVAEQFKFLHQKDIL